MKFKITAGAELDLLTKGEVADVLKNWGHELTRGARFRRRSVAGVVDAAGALTIGGGIGSDDTLGPAEGFVWAVTRLSVTGLTGLESVNVYINDASPSSLAVPEFARVEYIGDHGLVLVSGDQLVISGASLTVGASVTVTLQIKEVPALMAWSL